MSSSVLLHKLQLVFNPDESFICQLRHSKIFYTTTILFIQEILPQIT